MIKPAYNSNLSFLRKINGLVQTKHNKTPIAMPSAKILPTGASPGPLIPLPFVEDFA